jgi:hypothetical protein
MTPVVSPATVDIGLDTLSGAFDDIASRAQIASTDGVSGNQETTYIRSQYAPAYGLDISKVYTNATHATLYTGDRITATIRIRNTTTRSMI